MTTPEITALPDAPTPQDAPEVFNDKSFRLVAAQAQFVAEANVLAGFVADAAQAAAGADGSAAAANESALAARDVAVEAQEVAVAAQEEVSAVAAQFGDVAGAIAAAEAASAGAGDSEAVAVMAKDLAQTAKAQAEAAKTQAEAARDAAAVNGKVYTTTAAGLAATSGTGDVNRYFSVPASGSAEYLILYLNNAGAAVEQKRYPSKSAVDALGQVFDNSRFTFQGYLLNGTYIANSLYRATDYLHVEGGASYAVTTASAGNLTNDWYDANKVFISSFQSPPAISTVTVAAPANARFLRVSNTAAGAANALAGVVAAVPSVNIAQVVKILKDNPPVLSSESVTYGAVTVKTKLDSFDATQAFLLAKQNDLLSELDLITDESSPFFVNTWEFTKSSITPATQLEVAVAARVDDSTFTVSAGGGASLPGNGGALVVKDQATGQHYSLGVKSNASDTIAVFGVLPAALSVCQTMHDSVNGQHLSRMACKALPDFVIDRTQKYSYKKKKPIFVYHAPTSSTPVFNNPDVYKLDNTTKIVDMTLLGGAGNGGFVDGNLTRGCSQVTADIGASSSPLSTYVSRAYVLQSGGAGDGYEFKFQVYGVSGFIEIPLGVLDQAYVKDSVTYRTSGRARVQVIGDGAINFLDQICDVGKEHFLYVDFAGAAEITVRVTLADTLPTAIRLHGAYAWQKSPETPVTGYFKNGDVVAFLGDSWTQFPPAISGETLPLRPDGSTADGMQFLSVRMKERLAADGISITTLNMGKGGQTSAWGLHWVGKMLELTPKPTYCVISFWINDYNSGAAAITGADTAYDFDPINMFVNKFQSAGGKKGAVTTDQWYANLQSICETLLRNGIKPIVLMPGHTASISQTQGFQQVMLNKIAPGFNNFNEDGGRE